MATRNSFKLGRWISSGLVLGVVLWACGGSVGGSSGGESHFLILCEAACGSGLSCISGVCTRSCLVGKSDCSDLSPDATCTDQSIEPGEVAVCDVACEAKADCANLGAGFDCEGGFCRGASSLDSSALATGSGGSSSGTVSSSSTGGSGSGDGGASTAMSVGGPIPVPGPGPSCQRLFQEYPDESMFADPMGCGQCVCDDGDVECTEEACEIGVPVFECPDGIMGDSIDVMGALLQGDALTLEVGYSGGCEQHDVGLCFGGGFEESLPVQGGLVLIHDSHGDACEAYITDTLTFDLRPYADYYKSEYQTDGGVILTNFGAYAFGELACEERTAAAEAQAQQAAERTLTLGCTTADDCQWASTDTSCYAGCGAVISANGLDQFQATLDSIDALVCGDFEGEGCDPVVLPPCVPPPELACVGGECAIVE